MTYFVIKGSEDGTKIAVLKDDASLKSYIEDCGLTDFRDQMSKGDHYATDPNYWPEKTGLIVKGEVIVPKPKQVVKDWEF